MCEFKSDSERIEELEDQLEEHEKDIAELRAAIVSQQNDIAGLVRILSGHAKNIESSINMVEKVMVHVGLKGK